MEVSTSHPIHVDDAVRAFRVLCIVYIVLGVVAAVAFFFGEFRSLSEAEAVTSGLLTSSAAKLRGWGRFGGIAAGLTIITFTLVHQAPRLRTRTQVTNVATLMILLLGALLLASRLVLQRVIPNFAAWGLLDLVVLHLAGSMIMLWTPREATLPFGLLLLVWAATFLVPTASTLEILDRVVIVIMSPIAFVPGVILAAWRGSRRQETAQRLHLEGQVEHLGSELSRPRIVHDAMFPAPFTGHIAFEYEYQPIQEIGGDYVHAHVDDDTGKVTLTLLDVAGHGLAAALTVNRLFGELERILAENADAEPSVVMGLLNRYINLTMARHSLFATGTCMMLDPSNGLLTWVNAGHPPSFVRHFDGSVADLPTTTMLLGVLGSEEFTADSSQITLHPGDVIIAYTDGAFEARDEKGDRFGLDSVRETARFSPPPRSWPRFIAGAVAKHHCGHADDDVLIAALTFRSLRVPDASELPIRTEVTVSTSA